MNDTSERAKARRAARALELRRRRRRQRAARDLRIVELLASGASMAEVAMQEGLSPRRLRELVAEILARRDVDPPAGFVGLQVRRLSEALMVAYGAMGEGDLAAVDRVVKIVRELDRYHGFTAAAATAPAPATPPAPPPPERVGAPPCAPWPRRAAEAAENAPPSD